ncbi:hypothetical protein BpHYR1_007830 [Brachionus plicatilis]|uniref:Uncharacterized protein n=1 Tax=Brachionus plicatilis TaxID=10195 RepID=A0A3M7T551_BRAPC|nr:hypothetical protein BpHYR1_007830 [Brachionus plicatilis]
MQYYSLLIKAKRVTKFGSTEAKAITSVLNCGILIVFKNCSSLLKLSAVTSRLFARSGFI